MAKLQPLEGTISTPFVRDRPEHRAKQGELCIEVKRVNDGDGGFKHLALSSQGQETPGAP